MPRPSQNETQRIPPLPEYERQFKAKFGRDMTSEEKRFYQLTRDLLAEPPDEDGDDGEAA